MRSAKCHPAVCLLPSCSLPAAILQLPAASQQLPAYHPGVWDWISYREPGVRYSDLPDSSGSSGSSGSPRMTFGPLKNIVNNRFFITLGVQRTHLGGTWEPKGPQGGPGEVQGSPGVVHRSQKEVHRGPGGGPESQKEVHRSQKEILRRGPHRFQGYLLGHDGGKAEGNWIY